MNWIVFHIASGQSFFTGILCIVVAAAASMASGSIARHLTVLPFLSGVIAVVVSSAAIPYWFYLLAGVITLCWIATRFARKWRRHLAIAVIVVWTVALALELPYHFCPRLTPIPTSTVAIIGDSITAGMGGEDTAETWPNLLANQHNIDVCDFSHVGETASSAVRRIKDVQIDASLVIVEIGGNDLLGTRSAGQFARDLDALLTAVRSPQRHIVMFELPLPPLCHEYGRVQRSLARKHGVALIPKRELLSILAPSESTLDTIHLSQSGHQQMSDCIWQLIGPALPH